ncbi:MAG TPA: hypothetical protein VEL49_02095 [Ktedonobacteraceae bacterium]|nr:hypothetical protein [Ktedonobacteraceae bacterium]
MSKQQLHEITVPLDDIQELFADPEPGSDRFVSGMDYLYGEVRVHTRVLKQPHRYKVTLELPHEKITDDLLGKTRAKIKRYCQFKAEQSHKDLMVLRLQGLDSLRRSLWVALISVVLGIGATAYSQSGVNSVLEAVLLFIVAFCVLGAGWVAVWMPFEYFLYDGWPFQQNMRIYNQIADADIVIKACEGEVPEHVEDTEVARGSSLL